MFLVGCVYIYHVSGYMSIKHKVDISSTETVKAKLTFDRKDQIQGFTIKGYHTDNGILNASESMEEPLKNQK